MSICYFCKLRIKHPSLMESACTVYACIMSAHEAPALCGRLTDMLRRSTILSWLRLANPLLIQHLASMLCC